MTIHRSLLTAAAGYLALVGLGLMLVPQYFGIGAVPPDASHALLAFLRIFGGPCLGIAVLNWQSRRGRDSAEHTTILLSNAVGFAAVALADVWGVFHGARPIAKVFLIIHIGFAVGFMRAVRSSSVKPH